MILLLFYFFGPVLQVESRASKFMASPLQLSTVQPQVTRKYRSAFVCYVINLWTARGLEKFSYFKNKCRKYFLVVGGSGLRPGIFILTQHARNSHSDGSLGQAWDSWPWAFHSEMTKKVTHAFTYLAAYFIFALLIYLAALRLEMKALCMPRATTPAEDPGNEFTEGLVNTRHEKQSFCIEKINKYSRQSKKEEWGSESRRMSTMQSFPLLHEHKVSTGDKEGMVFLPLALLEVSHSHKTNNLTVNTIKQPDSYLTQTRIILYALTPWSAGMSLL